MALDDKKARTYQHHIPEEAEYLQLVRYEEVREGPTDEGPRVNAECSDLLFSNRRGEAERNSGRRFCWKAVRWAEIKEENQEEEYGELRIYDERRNHLMTVVVDEAGFEALCSRIGTALLPEKEPA